MPTFTADHLRQLCTDLFVACSAPRSEAHVVADELVESSLMGYDSHGVMRTAQYIRDALDGRIKPGAPVRVAHETTNTAIVDCGLNFGAVSAQRMVEIACDKARQHGIACVVSRNSHHVGRLGAWPQKIAVQGLIGLAFANNTRRGHMVAPWGGRQGRLGTNPLAYAAPAKDGQFVLMDMSTCMIPEGKIRVHLHNGTSVPPNCILDAEGHPTSDPKAFYGPPRGAILPFGSQYGYKGFGLGLLVEILGGLLAGYEASREHAHVNGLCLIAIDPEAFCGADHFKELLADLSAYVTSAPLADEFNEVVVPGTPDLRMREKRLREGIPLPAETWRQIVEAGARLGVELAG
jgi:uncharacterized oxidoreductase